jgi:hypothetical protein
LATGYFAYQKIMGESAAPTSGEEPRRPATPSSALNAVGAAPAKAIQNAEAAVASVEGRTEIGAKEVFAGEETHAKPIYASTPKEKPIPPVTSTTQLAPGLTVTTTASGIAGNASPAFRSWVAQALISGVFQGEPARILINGKMVTSGQLVDESLAITFEGINATSSSLIFRDPTGASVARRF